MLEVRGLDAGYGRIPILNGIDVSIARGEIVGVLGHNGMGKTTLLRTLMGEIRATGGSIRFEGSDITRLAMHRRARLGIGYVPQGRDIYPQLSVMDNLRMGEIVRRGQSAVPELLDYFPLLRALTERPGRALSGGEQQILALARCLAGRPRLLLLDEPTEGIQPSIVDQIQAKLAELARRSTSRSCWSSRTCASSPRSPSACSSCRRAQSSPPSRRNSSPTGRSWTSIWGSDREVPAPPHRMNLLRSASLARSPTWAST